MVCHRLVSGLPESLAPLPLSPAPPCTPCVEGRQRAAPHSSSFPPTTAPFQTLHLDVWGPSPVLGPLRYVTHQLNLWPCDAWPRVTPVFLWAGSPGIAADFRVWGSLAHVRAPGTNKLPPCTRVCVFLGFPLDASSCPPQSRPGSSPPPPFTSCPINCVARYFAVVSPKRPVLIVSGGEGGAIAEGEGNGVVGAGGVEEPRLVGKAKHIQLRYFLLRELQQRGQARMVHVVSL
ncbi:unnamed protein product [Closterium sp. NIES-53]